MKKNRFRPRPGDYYWVALTPHKIFSVQYQKDEADEAWIRAGKAYPTKQDALEGMGRGKPISSPLKLLAETIMRIDLRKHPDLTLQLVARDGNHTLDIRHSKPHTDQTIKLDVII
ncbi:hypothetical protein [Porphyromonas loveana]|uniref:hypothetical protein n=1 Tax=Porphyromonas loveana TaxID=1884669 RepID=UPI00359F4CAC